MRPRHGHGHFYGAEDVNNCVFLPDFHRPYRFAADELANDDTNIGLFNFIWKKSLEAAKNLKYETEDLTDDTNIGLFNFIWKSAAEAAKKLRATEDLSDDTNIAAFNFIWKKAAEAAKNMKFGAEDLTDDTNIGLFNFIWKKSLEAAKNLKYETEDLTDDTNIGLFNFIWKSAAEAAKKLRATEDLTDDTNIGAFNFIWKKAAEAAKNMKFGAEDVNNCVFLPDFHRPYRFAADELANDDTNIGLFNFIWKSAAEAAKKLRATEDLTDDDTNIGLFNFIWKKSLEAAKNLKYDSEDLEDTTLSFFPWVNVIFNAEEVNNDDDTNIGLFNFIWKKSLEAAKKLRATEELTDHISNGGFINIRPPHRAAEAAKNMKFGAEDLTDDDTNIGLFNFIWKSAAEAAKKLRATEDLSDDTNIAAFNFIWKKAVEAAKNMQFGAEDVNDDTNIGAFNFIWKKGADSRRKGELVWDKMNHKWIMHEFAVDRDEDGDVNISLGGNKYMKDHPEVADKVASVFKNIFWSRL